MHKVINGEYATRAERNSEHVKIQHVIAGVQGDRLRVAVRPGCWTREWGFQRKVLNFEF